MSRAGQLYDLQQIDSGLDSRVARMRQIDALTTSDEAAAAARAVYQEAEKELAARQASLKKASHEVEDAGIRLRKDEKRLFDGSIKNPKELASLQEEVTHLKARLKNLEDSTLDAMLAAEEAETALNTRRQELDAAENEWQQYVSGLGEEKDSLLSQAKVLQVKRQRAISEMPWGDLQTYERLRRAKGGTAVVAVQNGLCGGCHVGVPAHILRQARSGTEPVTCPSCGRILFPIGEIKFEEFNHDLDNINR